MSLVVLAKAWGRTSVVMQNTTFDVYSAQALPDIVVPMFPVEKASASLALVRVH
jgi:hypothetical protein